MYQKPFVSNKKTTRPRIYFAISIWLHTKRRSQEWSPVEPRGLDGCPGGSHAVEQWFERHVFEHRRVGGTRIGGTSGRTWTIGFEASGCLPARSESSTQICPTHLPPQRVAGPRLRSNQIDLMTDRAFPEMDLSFGYFSFRATVKGLESPIITG